MEHGTNSRYMARCRCPRCKAAHAAEARKQRKRDRERKASVTIEVLDSEGRVVRTKRFTLPRGEYTTRGRVTYII